MFTGQLVVTDPGTYQILGFGDDDTFVIVDGQVVSADPFGHGIRDPAPNRGATPTPDLGVPDRSDRFVRPVTLAAGEHDIVILQHEGGGGSGVRLQWIRPGQTAIEVVPAANLNTRTPAPANGAPTVTDAESRGSNVLMNFNRPQAGRTELKTILEIATDAGFTQNYRKIVLGPGSEQVRVFGLTPNTGYFARATFKNFEGDVTTPVGQFNSSGAKIPDPATNLTGRGISPTQVRLNWQDNAFDETNYVVQRRLQGGTFADIATLPANTTTYLDTLDPVPFPQGTLLEYQVIALNDAGRSPPSNVLLVNVGFPGGTGLRRRVWDDEQAALNPDNIVNVRDNANMRLARIGEPGLTPEGTPTAPLVDEVDPILDDGYGTGVPAPGVGAETFAIEWVGEIYAEQTKAYEFSIVGDDGVRLWINDKVVIDNSWQDQGDTEYFSEPVNLTAGQKVKVRFQMYEQGGGATARLRWNGPGGVREAIPQSFLFPTVGPNDEVANIPFRPVTGAKAFPLPGATDRAPTIALKWEDNAFGEAGYEIQRATNSTFTTGVTTWGRDASGVPIVNAGRRTFIDNGTNPDGSTTDLNLTTTYSYRVRPLGAPDTAWVVAGSTKPIDVEAAGQDLAIPTFNGDEWVTTNGDATTTAEGTLKLTQNVNYWWGSAWLNRSFDISHKFTVDFDQQIGNSNGADGATFMIQNFIPATPAGVLPTQLTAIGGTGGNLGANGITPSVAVVFDFHDNLDTLGVYTNGGVPPGGGITAHQLYDNSDPNAAPFAPGGDVDLRNAANNTAGTGAINIDGNTKFKIELQYDPTGNDPGTPTDPTDDTGLLIVRMFNAAGTTKLNESKWAINIAQTLDSPTGVMGWTAANGGLNARYEESNFKYDGPGVGGVPVSAVYVRGSSWLGDDANATNVTFKEYLQSHNLGNTNYGYKVFDATAPNAQVNDIIPWINVDEVVVQFASTPSGRVSRRRAKF